MKCLFCAVMNDDRNLGKYGGNTPRFAFDVGLPFVIFLGDWKQCFMCKDCFSCLRNSFPHFWFSSSLSKLERCSKKLFFVCVNFYFAVSDAGRHITLTLQLDSSVWHTPLDTNLSFLTCLLGTLEKDHFPRWRATNLADAPQMGN